MISPIISKNKSVNEEDKIELRKLDLGSTVCKGEEVD